MRFANSALWIAADTMSIHHFSLSLSVADSCYNVSLSDPRRNRLLASESLTLPDYSRLETEYLSALRSYIETPFPPERLQSLGEELALLLFPSRIQDALLAELAQDADPLLPVRLHLRAEGLALQKLPWEFAFINLPSLPCGFLGQSPRFHLVRQLTSSQTLPSVLADPLRILVAWADPRSAEYPALPYLQTEVRCVLAALQGGAHRRVVVEHLSYATSGALQRALTEWRPHVLHFIGHGDLKPTGGVLALQGDQPGSVGLLYGEMLARWLPLDTLRLVVLSACRTAGSERSVGAVLASVGVPAVIAMQLPFRDASAELFSGTLYSALMEPRPVDAALQRARKAISGIGPDWGAPTLYLRGDSGDLFHFATPSHVSDSRAAYAPVEAKEPLQSAATIPGAPLPTTRFFGRMEERRQLTEMLCSGDHRLITLTGLGGSGKTRLAIEVGSQLAATFAERISFIPLAHVTDPALILVAMVNILRLNRPTEPIAWQQVYEALGRRPSLLIIDNLEQLVEGGAEIIGELLAHVPTLICLVTSRQKLNLAEETEVPISPLPTPDAQLAPDQILAFPSVQLFQDRTRSVRPDFQITTKNAEAVAALCRALEGIPLALELAAARAQVLTPSQMLGQLKRRLDFLTSRHRDTAERHRTLRAAIDWSYARLSPELRRFFARLAVFRAGWTLEAAETICEEPQALDYLEQLRECSLIQTKERNAEICFTMLETLREYALEHLHQKERAPLSRRHAEYFLALAEEAEPELSLKQQGQWQYRIEAEMDNMRAALAWCKTSEGDADLGLRLAGALSGFWYMRGFLSEGWERLAEALSQAKSSTQDEVRAKTLRRAARLVWFQGDYASVRALHEQSLALYRQLGNSEEVAVTLYHLGLVVAHQGNPATADACFAEADQLFQTLGDRRAHAHVLCCIGEMAWFQGDYGVGNTIQNQSLRIAREIGSRRDIAYSLANLANIAAAQQDYALAHEYLDEALALLQELGERWGYGYVLWSMGNLARMERDYGQARLLGCEAVRIAWELKNEWGIAFALESLGYLAVFENDAERAALLLGAATALRKSIGSPLPTFTHADYQRSMLSAHTALGEQAFARAWTLGATMPLEATIEKATEPASDA